MGEAVDALKDQLNEEEIMSACTTSLRVLGTIASDKAERGGKARARADVEASLLAKGVIMDTDDLPALPYLRKKRK